MEIIERIKKAINGRLVKFTEHARVAMLDDDLITEEVMKALRDVEIIEEYHNAKPFPACLAPCHLNDGNPLHVVIALPEEELTARAMIDNLIIIVTVYRPSELAWTDHRKRKS